MESLKSKKFDSFESERISNLSTVFGGVINSPADRCGCTDTYDWTERTRGTGTNTFTVKVQDNLVWSCPTTTDSTCVR